MVGYLQVFLKAMNSLTENRLTKNALQLKKIDEGTHSEKIALVIGAGGTALAACYAVKTLGMQLLVYNRTPGT